MATTQIPDSPTTMYNSSQEFEASAVPQWSAINNQATNQTSVNPVNTPTTNTPTSSSTSFIPQSFTRNQIIPDSDSDNDDLETDLEPDDLDLDLDLFDRLRSENPDFDLHIPSNSKAPKGTIWQLTSGQNFSTPKLNQPNVSKFVILRNTLDGTRPEIRQYPSWSTFDWSKRSDLTLLSKWRMQLIRRSGGEQQEDAKAWTQKERDETRRFVEEVIALGEVETKIALFEAVSVKLEEFFVGVMQKKGESLALSDGEKKVGVLKEDRMGFDRTAKILKDKVMKDFLDIKDIVNAYMPGKKSKNVPAKNGYGKRMMEDAETERTSPTKKSKTTSTADSIETSKPAMVRKTAASKPAKLVSSASKELGSEAHGTNPFARSTAGDLLLPSKPLEKDRKSRKTKLFSDLEAEEELKIFDSLPAKTIKKGKREKAKPQDAITDDNNFEVESPKQKKKKQERLTLPSSATGINKNFEPQERMPLSSSQ